MVGRSLVLPALLLLSACGWGGDDTPAQSVTETLSRSDVTGLPPGTAQGALFSGTYLVETSQIEGCVCRTGNCSPFQALTGATSTVSEVDGAITSQGDGTCTGGVDQNGRFWCGEAEEAGGQAVYGREQGTFLLVDGKPASKEFTVDTTVVVTISGQSYDCDLHASGSARYVGP